jgi:multiple sugar transport system ATP-binding protein
MVFQSYALYPNMNVESNISFGLEMRGVPKAERQQAVGKVAKMLQIENLLKRKPGQLSGGQRQRVAMGRALVRDPKIFLFDEPLSNLDAKLRVDMRTEIKQLHQRMRATIVYVTHDQIEAMTLATRIAIMNHGELQQLGTPQEVYERPANTFVAGFIGSPSMNLMPAVVADNGHTVLLRAGHNAELQLPQRYQHRAELNGRAVLLGMRPEHISDGGEGAVALQQSIDCLVEVLEPTGPETLGVLKLGDQALTARLKPDTQARVGQTMAFQFAMNKAILFDAQSEQLL